MQDGIARTSAPEFLSISLDNALPPLPGEKPERIASDLGRGLWSLMARAGRNVLPGPVHRSELGLTDEFDALVEAAGQVVLTSGHRLSELLWTRSGPYWKGALARTLILQQARQGFLLLLAQSVTPRAVLFGHASPLVVELGIEGDLDLAGPHLVLLVCTVDPTGKAVARRGYAQAIKSARCFMPVGSAFERDALEALIALREKLDCHGVECTIMRDLGEEGFAREWQVGLRREATTIGQLRIVLPGDVGIAEDGEMGAAMAEDGAYALTPANFADGRFVAWLEREIVENGAANGG
ncbi:hypothetical protein [Novosphingobium sp. YAF33]|uniref:hypothetical protein n=1 Tax=Novosphingobium sp. YAF33 TaxID=3233082 RepID=UPI003F9738BB